MSINYTGYSSYPVLPTRLLQAHVRAMLDVETLHCIDIVEARPLNRFDADIAREFGIEAGSRFHIGIRDKSGLHLVHPVLDLLYQTFGTAHLRLLWGTDTVVEPKRDYAGHKTVIHDK